MDFGTSIKTCFSKYAVFSGRASRSEFWWFALFGLIGGIVTVVIDVMILGYSAEDNGPVNIIFTIVTFLPYLAVGARRLHDINRSGWWQLITLTVIGIILLIIWWATVGENKKNVHGSPLKLKKQYKLKFDLLSDEKKEVIKKYGVWGKKSFLGKKFMGIVRTTFLINYKGKIHKIWSNVRVKDHAKEVFKEIKNI